MEDPSKFSKSEIASSKSASKRLHKENSHKHHKCCAHTHDQLPNQQQSSIFDSTFIHQVGDLVQDIGLMIVSITLLYKPNWDIIDPIITILTSLLGNQD